MSGQRESCGNVEGDAEEERREHDRSERYADRAILVWAKTSEVQGHSNGAGFQRADVKHIGSVGRHIVRPASEGDV